MIRRVFANPGLAILTIFSLATIGLIACGTAVEPQDRRIDLSISDGKINFDPPVIVVNQGDTVTMNIASDEHGTVHLHGYDIEKDVGPDGAIPLEVAADATGRYNFTFHAGGGWKEPSLLITISTLPV